MLTTSQHAPQAPDRTSEKDRPKRAVINVQCTAAQGAEAVSFVVRDEALAGQRRADTAAQLASKEDKAATERRQHEAAIQRLEAELTAAATRADAKQGGRLRAEAERRDAEEALLTQLRDAELALQAEQVQSRDSEQALRAQLRDAEEAQHSEQAQRCDTEQALRAQLRDAEQALQAEQAQRHDAEQALRAQLCDVQKALQAEQAQLSDAEQALHSEQAQHRDAEQALQAQLRAAEDALLWKNAQLLAAEDAVGAKEVLRKKNDALAVRDAALAQHGAAEDLFRQGTAVLQARKRQLAEANAEVCCHLHIICRIQPLLEHLK